MVHKQGAGQDYGLRLVVENTLNRIKFRFSHNPSEYDCNDQSLAKKLGEAEIKDFFKNEFIRIFLNANKDQEEIDSDESEIIVLRDFVDNILIPAFPNWAQCREQY